MRCALLSRPSNDCQPNGPRYKTVRVYHLEGSLGTPNPSVKGFIAGKILYGAVTPSLAPRLSAAMAFTMAVDDGDDSAEN